MFCTCKEDASMRSNVVCRHLYVQLVQLRAYREQILAECRKVVIDLIRGEGGAVGEFWPIFEVAMSILDDCSKWVRSARGYLGVQPFTRKPVMELRWLRAASRYGFLHQSKTFTFQLVGSPCPKKNQWSTSGPVYVGTFCLLVHLTAVTTLGLNKRDITPKPSSLRFMYYQ